MRPILEIHERCPQIPGGNRCIEAKGQPSRFATADVVRALRQRIHLFQD